MTHGLTPREEVVQAIANLHVTHYLIATCEDSATSTVVHEIAHAR
jgi:hypothetical protein